MGETCNKTRILSVVVAALVLVLAAVVAAFIYRETRSINDQMGGHVDMWTELNENTVKDLYPAFFRSQEEQRVFKESFQQSFYFNRTVIQPTVNSNETCSFTCFPGSTGRKKRQSTIELKHGCCTSRATFYVPTNHTNHKGQVRSFLQYEKQRQFFTNQSCTALISCRGCVCSQEKMYVPAVVLKIGVQKAVHLDDTEIDLFSFPGCCKCVNT